MDLSESGDRTDGTEEVPEDHDEFTDLLEQVTQATEEGRSEDALGLMGAIMEMMAERDENEVPSLHIAIRCEAEEREAEADWAGAEAAYRRAVEIAGDNPHWAFKSHDELRSLYMFLGRPREALEEARAAVEAGREAIGILHARALLSQALVHLNLGQATKALDLVTQSLSIHDSDRLPGWMRGRALAIRARCSVELEDEAAARSDLNASWVLLASESAMASLPGVQGAFGSWWRTEAALRCRTGDAIGWVKAWREVVLSRRWNAAQPQIAGPYVHAGLADALEQLARAQEAAGDSVSAVENMAESRAIRKEIGQPRPPEP